MHFRRFLHMFIGFKHKVSIVWTPSNFQGADGPNNPPSHGGAHSDGDAVAGTIPKIHSFMAGNGRFMALGYHIY